MIAAGFLGALLQLIADLRRVTDQKMRSGEVIKCGFKIAGGGAFLAPGGIGGIFRQQWPARYFSRMGAVAANEAFAHDGAFDAVVQAGLAPFLAEHVYAFVQSPK